MGRIILKITSRKLGKGGQIPEKYSRRGRNINMPIDIENIPEATKSLAVVMESSDSDGILRTHWVHWNIPVTEQIREEELRGETGLNYFGGSGYMGPEFNSTPVECTFRIYALDRFLEFSNAKVSKSDLEGSVLYYGVGHGKLICSSGITKGSSNRQSVNVKY